MLMNLFAEERNVVWNWVTSWRPGSQVDHNSYLNQRWHLTVRTVLLHCSIFLLFCPIKASELHKSYLALRLSNYAGICFQCIQQEVVKPSGHWLDVRRTLVHFPKRCKLICLCFKVSGVNHSIPLIHAPISFEVKYLDNEANHLPALCAG